MGLFSAAMRLCDDCDRENGELDWWGDHIRICPTCRAIRLLDQAELATLSTEPPTPKSGEGVEGEG